MLSPFGFERQYGSHRNYLCSRLNVGAYFEQLYTTMPAHLND